MKSPLKRRSFISIAVKVPLFLAATVSGAGIKLAHALTTGGPGLSAHQIATLERLTFLLFPYPDLGTSPYQQIVSNMDKTTQKQADQLALITEGIDQLDGMGPEFWMERPEKAQLEALKKIEGRAFFQWALRSTKEQLFRDKGLWALIGYEGSSLEKGGYINRGLNDIDWL